MKGDVSPVVYLVAALIIAVIIIAALFLLGLNPFSDTFWKKFCEAKIIEICGKYRNSGNQDVFKELSCSCIKDRPGCENVCKGEEITQECIDNLCGMLK